MPGAQRGYDAVVVGSGPNGLVAAITLAKAGASVLLLEASDSAGGGCRSAQLTLPGFVHDICSAVHPTGAMSPAFREIGMEQLGVKFLSPDIALAHPLPDGEVAMLQRSLDATASDLGQDGKGWVNLMRPFADRELIEGLFAPMWFNLSPIWRKLRFGLLGLRSCDSLVQNRFTSPKARALFGGCAAHSILSLDRAGTASFGLVLAASAHVVGWPIVQGGSQEITNALVRRFTDSGGVLELNRRVTALDQLPPAKAILFDLNPHQVASICGSALPPRYRTRLTRFRHGPGIFKVDWALDGPIPWRNPECARAGTVHVGGIYEEIFEAESDVARGRAPQKPFVLLAQQSMFDDTRSPAGKHTAWGYCHVPNGCTEDMTARIEAQIERFAPGFRGRILGRHTINPAQLETHNAAMIGGDIAGGANDLLNFLIRPVLRWNPYTTPNPKIFTCSSSTPPGAGVHGMCGYLAARAVLRRQLGHRQR
jgi:phytoene dehydrogenase-like protein